MIHKGFIYKVIGKSAARYTFTDLVRVYNNNLYLEGFNFVDEWGNQGTINGSITNNYLHDFYTSIRIQARNMNCMNTSSEDNELFYGNVFATGNATISGGTNGYNFTIDTRCTININRSLFLFTISIFIDRNYIRDCYLSFHNIRVRKIYS